MQIITLTETVITATAAVAALMLAQWRWHRSGPVIKLRTTAITISGEARCTVPGQLADDLGIILIDAHNYGRGPGTIEELGFETRTRVSFGPPLRQSEEADAWNDISSWRVDGHQRRRWAVEEPWLEAMCDRERVRREDVRPWVKVSGKRRKIRPRRWGLPHCYQTSRWRDTNWLAWHRWRKRISRPVSVVLRPHLIPVYETTDRTRSGVP